MSNRFPPPPPNPNTMQSKEQLKPLKIGAFSLSSRLVSSIALQYNPLSVTVWSAVTDKLRFCVLYKKGLFDAEDSKEADCHCNKER